MEAKNNRVVRCPVCEAEVRRGIGARNHLWGDHRGEIATLNSQVLLELGLYMCTESECGQGPFVGRGGLARHRGVHIRSRAQQIHSVSYSTSFINMNAEDDNSSADHGRENRQDLPAILQPDDDTIEQDMDNDSIISCPDQEMVDANNVSDIACTICISTIMIGQPQVTLNCEHKYHRECIDEWAIRQTNCPNCRAPFHSGLAFEGDSKEVVINYDQQQLAYRPNEEEDRALAERLQADAENVAPIPDVVDTMVTRLQQVCGISVNGQRQRWRVRMNGMNAGYGQTYSRVYIPLIVEAVVRSQETPLRYNPYETTNLIDMISEQLFNTVVTEIMAEINPTSILNELIDGAERNSWVRAGDVHVYSQLYIPAGRQEDIIDSIDIHTCDQLYQTVIQHIQQHQIQSPQIQSQPQPQPQPQTQPQTQPQSQLLMQQPQTQPNSHVEMKRAEWVNGNQNSMFLRTWAHNKCLRRVPKTAQPVVNAGFATLLRDYLQVGQNVRSREACKAMENILLYQSQALNQQTYTNIHHAARQDEENVQTQLSQHVQTVVDEMRNAQEARSNVHQNGENVQRNENKQQAAERKARRVVNMVQAGHISKANQMFGKVTVGTIDEAAEQKIASLNPPASLPTYQIPNNKLQPVVFEEELLMKVLAQCDTGVGLGPSKTSIEFLRQFAESSAENRRLMMDFLQCVANNRLTQEEMQESPRHVFTPLLLTRLVLLITGEKSRNVFCEEAIMKVIVTYEWMLARVSVTKALGYLSLGVGAKAGCELLTKAVWMAIENVTNDNVYHQCSTQALEEIASGGLTIERRKQLWQMPCLVKMDQTNCFNTCDRNMLRACMTSEEIQHMGPMTQLLTAAPRPYVYEAKGEWKVSFFEKGNNQGNPMAAAGASLVNAYLIGQAARYVIENEQAFQQHAEDHSCKPSAGTFISSVIDDCVQVLPFGLQVIYKRKLSELAQEHGLSFSHDKTKVMPLAATTSTNVMYEQLTEQEKNWMASMMEIPVQTGTQQSTVVPTVIIVGCPFASPSTDGTQMELINAHIDKVVQESIDKLKEMEKAKTPLEILDRQIRAQSGTMVTHLCRMVDPNIMMPHCKKLDEAVEQIIMKYTGTASLTSQQKQQLHLPLQMGGFGYQSAQVFCHYASYASWAQLAPQLMQLKEMNANTSMPGVAWRQASVETLRQVATYEAKDPWLPYNTSDAAFWSKYQNMVEDYANRGRKLRLQRQLTKMRHKQIATRMVEQATGLERARLASINARGAAMWLAQTPTKERQMSNTFFIISWRFRMGLPLFRKKATICRNGCRQELVGRYHVMQCKALNKRGKNKRHDALLQRLVKYLRWCEVIVSVEQHGWTGPEEKDDNKRPDTIWRPFTGRPVITDMKVVCPMTASGIPLSQNIISLTRTVENNTSQKYSLIEIQNRGRTLTACVETTGAQGVELRKLMRLARNSWVETRVAGMREIGGTRTSKEWFKTATREMEKTSADMAVLLQKWNAAIAIREQANSMHRFDVHNVSGRANWVEENQVLDIEEVLRQAGRLRQW